MCAAVVLRGVSFPAPEGGCPCPALAVLFLAAFGLA